MMTTAPTRTNATWLAALTASDAERDQALADLRAILMGGLRYSLSGWLEPDNPQFDPLAEEVAQETLVRVLAHLDSFEGRSQFTTWAHKIAARVALTELRRRRWRDVSLESLMEGEGGQDEMRLMADPAPDPAMAVEQADMLARLMRIMQEELTDKQRQALFAARVKGMPMEEVARRMGTQRNALYKLLHDARLRLKRRMAREGLSPGDVLAAFERG